MTLDEEPLTVVSTETTMPSPHWKTKSLQWREQKSGTDHLDLRQASAAAERPQAGYEPK